MQTETRFALLCANEGLALRRYLEQISLSFTVSNSEHCTVYVETSVLSMNL